MDRFNALGRGMQVMLVAGVLLFIDTFFNWQESGPFGVSAWDDFGGIIMGLLTIVLVLWIVARLAAIEIPIPVSPTLIAAGLAALIFLFALIKNLQDDYSSVWAWIGLILSIAILVGAWLQVQASGGMDALKAELPSMPAASSTASQTPPPPASEPMAPPPPASEPMAPPPPASEPMTPPAPAAAPPDTGTPPATPSEPPPAEEPPKAPPESEPPGGSTEEPR
jgi:hypothetical protein